MKLKMLNALCVCAHENVMHTILLWAKLTQLIIKTINKSQFERKYFHTKKLGGRKESNHQKHFMGYGVTTQIQPLIW